MTTAEPRNVALQFATHKVPTFPVRVSQLGDRWLKRPHISEWATRASYSKAQITEWWHCWPNAMVGVPLARVGLVVVDADRHPGAPDGVAALRAIELPPHPIITTRSGGEHHFFRQPNSQLRFARWAGGEILGVGRFVVGYDLAPFVSEVPQWPEWLMAKLPHSHMGTTGGANAGSNSGTGFAVAAVPMCGSLERPPTDYELNYANASLRNDYGELWSCKPGDRNRKLNAIAYAMGRLIVRGWIPRDRVESYLLKCCEANGLLADDGLAQCRATLASRINAGMKRPCHDIDRMKFSGAAL